MNTKSAVRRDMDRRSFLRTTGAAVLSANLATGRLALAQAKIEASSQDGILLKAVTTSRHTTAYVEAGPADGPTIFLVHGWPGLSRTWRHQITALAALGFRVVAPDLRGCGRSSVYTTHGAFAQREIVRDMVELADALKAERAVWIGHDWGAIVVSNIAHHHTERCIAVGGISQPFNCLERGSSALVPLVNRRTYPIAEFPAGQFEYMEFYHEHFREAEASFEANVVNMLKAVMRRGDPAGANKPFLTAFVRKQGGWFGPGGHPAPDLPLDSAIFDDDDLRAFSGSYSQTGFFGVNSLYMNDADNRDYFDSVDGKLKLPVLFLSGSNDFVCDTEHSDLAKPMRAACSDLTFRTIASGHWMTHERPAAVTAAICRWIADKVPSFWPT